jgi:hypothetical protein
MIHFSPHNTIKSQVRQEFTRIVVVVYVIVIAVVDFDVNIIVNVIVSVVVDTVSRYFTPTLCLGFD